MVRTRTYREQAGTGGGNGRPRRTMRVRRNHANQQKSRTPDRSRRRDQGAGDGASVLSVAADRCRVQGAGICALRRRFQDCRGGVEKSRARGLAPITSASVVVMAGLDPAIHVLLQDSRKTWLPGTRPGMTATLLLFKP